MHYLPNSNRIIDIKYFVFNVSSKYQNCTQGWLWWWGISDIIILVNIVNKIDKLYCIQEKSNQNIIK